MILVTSPLKLLDRTTKGTPDREAIPANYQAEIEEARTTDWKGLRDPESDETRTKKPEWLVMLGVCTHLGCVPIGEAGDYGGWCVCPSSARFRCTQL